MALQFHSGNRHCQSGGKISLPQPTQECLYFSPNGKRVISPRFQLIVPLFQKPSQRFFNQGTPQRGLDEQFSLPEAPLKLPLKLISPHLTFNLALLPALASNPNIGGSLR